ncbi:MAG: hypothetical protein Q7T55_07080 [Solirubrobacteraceae bacterium]|nr:hypothetical protein [Solirubrobacteraceae bacterium]
MPTVRRTALIALTGIATLTVASTAQAGCAVTPTKKAFAAFGDYADYTLAPGANFESGSSGWSLGGASIVAGNESFFVGSKSDSKSLAISATGRVVSPSFCVGIEHPNFRLVARRTTGTWGVLYVKLRSTDSGGRVNETVVGSINGTALGKWTVSQSYGLSSVLALWSKTQSTTAQIVLDAEKSGGNWQVDDIYIDPYRRS